MCRVVCGASYTVTAIAAREGHASHDSAAAIIARRPRCFMRGAAFRSLGGLQMHSLSNVCQRHTTRLRC